MKTYRDLYPTGYAHCAICKRWRPVSDFTVHTWADEPQCTVPRQLDKRCRTCNARRKRAKRGQKPRVWYAYGAPGTEQARRHRNARLRERRKWRKAHEPGYRDDYNEYRRIWNHSREVTPGPARGQPPATPILVSPKPFLRWFDGQSAEVYLTKTEEHRIANWRRQLNADLVVIDRIMTRHGDMDQVAVLYPLEDELSAAV